MTTSYYFWRLQKVGLLRGREKMVYWCIPLFLPCFLSSFYQFLSLFLFVLFTLSCLLLSYRGLFFSLGYFPFWIPLSLGASLSKCLPWVLTALLPWVPPLRCFPFSSMATASFYSELIQWDFSLLPLGFHQLFLACCWHSFRTVHQPIGCLTTTSAQYMFVAPLLISWQNFILFVLVVYLYLWVQNG